jgi:hypothetical protein
MKNARLQVSSEVKIQVVAFWIMIPCNGTNWLRY